MTEPNTESEETPTSGQWLAEFEVALDRGERLARQVDATLAKMESLTPDDLRARAR